MLEVFLGPTPRAQFLFGVFAGEARTGGAQLGLHVAAGRGLTVRNVGAVAHINEVEEFNIGHSIVSQAILVGLENSVRAIRAVIANAGQ